jgi:hypothetical protein
LERGWSGITSSSSSSSDIPSDSSAMGLYVEDVAILNADAKGDEQW